VQRAMADSSCSSVLVLRRLHPIRHLRTSRGTRFGSALLTGRLVGMSGHVRLWSVGDYIA
jgi:hypothetical protein